MKSHCIAILAASVLISIGSARADDPPSLADDLAPRFAVDDAGDASVTWWCDLAVDQVHLRKFSFETMSYGPDRLVSGTSENARNPRITYDGSNMAVVYEVRGTAGTSIVVGIIGDEPDPIPSVTLATTTFSGALDLTIQAQASHLWVTWIDDASNVGWSEYSYETQDWSAPVYENYDGSTVGAARSSIQSTVIGE